jgi:hypothetical protein
MFLRELDAPGQAYLAMCIKLLEVVHHSMLQVHATHSNKVLPNNKLSI